MTKPTGRPVGGPAPDWESHRREALDENIRDLRSMGESDAVIERRLGINLRRHDENAALAKSRKEQRAQGNTDPHEAA